MPKLARINAIKSLHCYTIGEAADAVGTSARTIRAWVKDGLQVMTAERPHLIRGDDLKRFVRSRRNSRRAKSALHMFHCFRCKAPREAAGGFAECQPSGPTLNLRALCAECECVMNKKFAKSRLPDLEGKLDLLDMGGGGVSQYEALGTKTAAHTAKQR